MAHFDPIDVFVDSGELGLLGRELAAVGGELGDLLVTMTGGLDPAPLGGQDVTAAVQDFSASWVPGGQALIGFLAESAEVVRFAISQYETAEHWLRGQAQAATDVV